MTAHNGPKSTLTRETPQAPVDTTNRERLLLVLGAAEEDALTIGDLRERCVRMPGQAIYELEPDGFPVERVHRQSRARRCSAVGYRLGAFATGARDHINARREVDAAASAGTAHRPHHQQTQTNGPVACAPRGP